MRESFARLVKLAPGTYILAVSGGVDSAVLLDILAKKARDSSKTELIVAHVDHGIRPDSTADARFVAGLAVHYGLPFELCSLSLGADASEQAARAARYAFLRQITLKYQATSIITAHHADDVVETVVLNIVRGTGWRGLASLRSMPHMLRPMLNVYKKDIVAYALEHRLEWYEDSTNAGDFYLRNRIRHTVIPEAVGRDTAFKEKVCGLWHAQCELRKVIDTELDDTSTYTTRGDEVLKTVFMLLEPVVALEILHAFLLQQGIRQTRPQLTRAYSFMREAGNGKQFSLNSTQFLEVRRHTFIVVTA